jgi:hypothetical protein
MQLNILCAENSHPCYLQITKTGKKGNVKKPHPNPSPEGEGLRPQVY